MHYTMYQLRVYICLDSKRKIFYYFYFAVITISFLIKYINVKYVTIYMLIFNALLFDHLNFAKTCYYVDEKTLNKNLTIIKNRMQKTNSNIIKLEIELRKNQKELEESKNRIRNEEQLLSSAISDESNAKIKSDRSINLHNPKLKAEVQNQYIMLKNNTIKIKSNISHYESKINGLQNKIRGNEHKIDLEKRQATELQLQKNDIGNRLAGCKNVGKFGR